MTELERDRVNQVAYQLQTISGNLRHTRDANTLRRQLIELYRTTGTLEQLMGEVSTHSQDVA